MQPRLLGGKGGFGSMLKTIGSQISKTKNKDSCRNLQGQRIITVNKAKRQDEAEKERKANANDPSIKKETEIEKLERRLENVSKDNINVTATVEKFAQEKQELVEKNERAVLAGLEEVSKNKETENKKSMSKKSILDDLSSSSESLDSS